MLWVRIHGTPLRQFVRDARSLPLLDGSQARHALLLSMGSLRAATTGEGAHLTFSLRNDAGQAAALYAVPPLGALAEVLDDDRVIFAGQVTGITLDEQASLEVQA